MNLFRAILSALAGHLVFVLCSTSYYIIVIIMVGSKYTMELLQMCLTQWYAHGMARVGSWSNNCFSSCHNMLPFSHLHPLLANSQQDHRSVLEKAQQCAYIVIWHIIIGTLPRVCPFLLTWFLLLIINPFMAYVTSQMAQIPLRPSVCSLILNLPPSLIVFCPHLNQLKHSVGVFTVFSKHTMWQNTSNTGWWKIFCLWPLTQNSSQLWFWVVYQTGTGQVSIKVHNIWKKPDMWVYTPHLEITIRSYTGNIWKKPDMRVLTWRSKSGPILAYMLTLIMFTSKLGPIQCLAQVSLEYSLADLFMYRDTHPKYPTMSKQTLTVHTCCILLYTDTPTHFPCAQQVAVHVHPHP